MYDAINDILKQHGHEVFTFERYSQEIRKPLDKLRAFREGIYSASARQAFSRLLEEVHPEIVHIHNLYPLISPSILLACREAEIPVVMRCPNFRLICPTGMHLRKGKICELCAEGREYWCLLTNCRRNILESFGYAIRSVIARKYRLFLDNVTIYLPPTEFAKQKLVRAGFPEKKMVTLPNMVSFHDNPTDPAKGEYVAFVGSMLPHKGIEMLLAAANQLHQIPFRLAGAGPLLPHLRRNTPPNVSFPGPFNHRDLSGFYRRGRFLVVPSLCLETFGLVAAEAMSHGLPVIASNIGGLPEVVENGLTGYLFAPGNVKELTDKIQHLWKNPDLCRAMGRNGREKVRRQYTPKIYYEKLLEIYQKAITSNISKSLPLSVVSKIRRGHFG